jgi:hypothetical protein
MADPAHNEYHRGEMDVSMQESTFHLFSALMKWGSLHMAALLVLLVLWFCTPAGFVGGLAGAIVLTAVGILILREKKTPAH